MAKNHCESRDFLLVFKNLSPTGILNEFFARGFLRLLLSVFKNSSTRGIAKNLSRSRQNALPNFRVSEYS